MSERLKTGIGVDATGGAVVDPTKNVLDLVEAERKRQDDLRNAQEKFVAAEVAHTKEMASLRADHQEKLDEKESDRLDKIRQVDITNAANSAAQTLTALQTLAAQTSATADTLRKENAAAMDSMSKRVTQLEQQSYEGAGKQKVADPQMEQLRALVESLASNQQTGAGKSEGMSDAMKLAIGIGSFITILITIGTFLFVTLRQPVAAPIYVPAPAGASVPATPPQGIPR